MPQRYLKIRNRSHRVLHAMELLNNISVASWNEFQLVDVIHRVSASKLAFLDLRLWALINANFIACSDSTFRYLPDAVLFLISRRLKVISPFSAEFTLCYRIH